MSTPKKQAIVRDERTGLPMREVRLWVPDATHPEVQARLKAARRAMNAEVEAESLRWIEAVSMFDNEDIERE